jgi:hypothetical protein
MKSERGFQVFYVVMLGLFVQSTYEYAQSPHTVNRVIAAVRSVMGLVFVSIKAWLLLRSPR